MTAFDSLSCAVPTKHALACDHPLITMHWQNVVGWTSLTPFKARAGKDGDALLGFEAQLSEPNILAHLVLCCTYPSFVMNVTDLQGGKQEVARIEHTASCCAVGRLRAYTVHGNTSEYVGEVVPGRCCSFVGQISNAFAEPIGEVSYTQRLLGGICGGKEELTLEGPLSRRCALTLADQAASQPTVYEMHAEEALSEAEKLLLMSTIVFASMHKEEWLA